MGGDALGQGPLAVDLLAEGVDDAAQPGGGGPDGETLGVNVNDRPGRDALDRANVTTPEEYL